MTEPEHVTITLTFTPLVAGRLAALAEAGPAVAYEDQADKIATVLDQLADHAQQGVRRPGSWQRGWITQALGEDRLENLEPDPEHADTGWQRPRNDA